jgi:hypothetical protein
MANFKERGMKMDPLIENMLNGFKGTIDNVVGTVGEENGATIRAIFVEMESLGEGNDYVTFMSQATEKDLFNRYNTEMTRLCDLAKTMGKPAS